MTVMMKARFHRLKWRPLNGVGGFTLIELLVVVAIIGILAAIALPKIAEAICSAKQGRTVARLNTIRSATRLYFIDHMDGEGGYYPYSLNEITRCSIHANPHSYLHPDGEGVSDLPEEEVPCTGGGPMPGDQITDWCDVGHTFCGNGVPTARQVEAGASKGGWNWCGGAGAGTGPGQYLPTGSVWIDEDALLFGGKPAYQY